MALIIDPATPVTLAAVVGDVLSSLIEAQAQAARTTVDFINDVGFLPAKPGVTPALRQVSFGYTKLDENQQPAQFKIDIPLLGMVDIPLICIRKATLTLDYEVQTLDVDETKSQAGSRNVVLRGRVLSGKKTPTSERAAINISVEVEKAELPPGLSRALDILEIAATESKTT